MKNPDNGGYAKIDRNYYQDKKGSLLDIFGASEIEITAGAIVVDGASYPVVDDVIVLLKPEFWTEELKSRIGKLNAGCPGKATAPQEFAGDIQFTFGKEWRKYPDILPGHQNEFKLYFDLVDTEKLSSSRVCDLGCGIGRWSYFLKDKARELILLDFSEAIFVARVNLKDAGNAMFFMGDIKKLPFRENFADLIFSLGVLHHLPTNALDEARTLSKYSKELLVFVYYDLDNRPYIWRVILYCVTLVRVIVSKIKSEAARSVLTWLITLLVYLPLICAGKLFALVKLGKYIPLYDFYHDKTVKRIQQDVYDRFFTRIENRYTRNEILKLNDTFKEVVISENLPYWHFLCRN